MSLVRKLEKAVVFLLRDFISPISPARCTRFMLHFYRRWGMKIIGTPNYISSKIWFDGTDYSAIELNEGCTISSYVRVLTHDWSVYTAARAVGVHFEKPVGIFRPIRIGRYAFVGSGTILLPGSWIGDGVIVGAGTVVRGRIPDFAIVTIFYPDTQS